MRGRRSFPAIDHGLAALGGHPLGAQGIVEDAPDGGGQAGRAELVAFRRDAVGDELGDAGVGRHRHRYAAQHRLHVHEAQRVDAAGEDEHTRRGVQPLQRVAALQPEKRDERLVLTTVLEALALRSVADQQQQRGGITRLQPLDRLDDDRQVLLLRQPADAEHHGAISDAQIQDLEHLGRPVRRREIIRVDGHRRHRQLLGLDAELDQHVARTRRHDEDAIDLRIEPGQVPPDAARHDGVPSQRRHQPQHLDVVAGRDRQPEQLGDQQTGETHRPGRGQLDVRHPLPPRPLERARQRRHVEAHARVERHRERRESRHLIVAGLRAALGQEHRVAGGAGARDESLAPGRHAVDLFQRIAEQGQPPLGRGQREGGPLLAQLSYLRRLLAEMVGGDQHRDGRHEAAEQIANAGHDAADIEGLGRRRQLAKRRLELRLSVPRAPVPSTMPRVVVRSPGRDRASTPSSRPLMPRRVVARRTVAHGGEVLPSCRVAQRCPRRHVARPCAPAPPCTARRKAAGSRSAPSTSV